MRFVYLFFSFLAMMACDDNTNSICMEFQKELKDTIRYDPVYEVDLDLDGEADGTLLSALRTSPGGISCSIKFKPFDEMITLLSKEKTVYVCQDTLMWNLDPSVEYYKNRECNDGVNALATEIVLVAELLQDDDLENLENFQRFNQEIFLYRYEGIGASGIVPGAIFNDVTVTIFENAISEGWLVIEKDNSALYGLKIGMDSSTFPCQSLKLFEQKRLDCE